MAFDKSARAAQLARCIDHTGDVWSFNGAEFKGNVSELRPDDPRLVGSADRLVEVTVATASLPSPAPRRGDEIIRNGRAHRISRMDTGLHGLTSILVVA